MSNARRRCFGLFQMNKITEETKKEVRGLIYDFFSEECGREKSRISDSTSIIEELGGDSLMFLSLLELVKKKYRLEFQLKTLGKYLMKKPASTVGQVIDLTLLIIQHGEGIKDL